MGLHIRFVLIVMCVLVNADNSTDPTVSVCPDGYVRFSSSCYKFYNQKFSWIEAMVYCKMFGRHLLTIGNRDEFRFLTIHMQDVVGKNTIEVEYGSRYDSHYGRRRNVPIANRSVYTGGYPAAGFWTSGTITLNTGHWKWATKMSDIDFNEIDFVENQVNNGTSKQACLMMARSHGYQAVQSACHNMLHFVCQTQI